jgi:hypothetical protein
MRAFTSSLVVAMTLLLLAGGAATARPWTFHKAVDNPDVLPGVARPWVTHMSGSRGHAVRKKLPAPSRLCLAPGRGPVRC